MLISTIPTVFEYLNQKVKFENRRYKTHVQLPQVKAQSH